MFSITDEYKALVDIASRSGGHRDAFMGKDAAYVVVHSNKILGANEISGLHIEASETDSGIDALITLDPGTKLLKPVHLCFGHLGNEGKQIIRSKVRVGEGADAVFMAHCVFPNAVTMLHAMEGEIELAAGSRFTYNEVHVHGPDGKIEVRPVSNVKIREKAMYRGDFTLIEGRVGDLNIDIQIDASGKESRVEITSKIYGKYDDICQVRDVVKLSGNGSAALIKARIVLRDNSRGRFLGMVDGAAAGARGHVDCTEVVQGNAVAEASPVVMASHSMAEVTHEAAIGRIADDKISGLMAKGLSEDEAVDMIVSGLLR